MHESGDALGDSRGSSSAPRWWEPYRGPRDFHRASARRSLAGNHHNPVSYPRNPNQDLHIPGCPLLSVLDCKRLLIKVVSGRAVVSTSFTGPWVHTVMGGGLRSSSAFRSFMVLLSFYRRIDQLLNQSHKLFRYSLSSCKLSMT
ncbi:hypothetical protein B296_00011954 [Ensete ventricosum]|uniref:Uncharacterized protein n=1 Tax=Ensete ventricosum TaxID=4639 RepID=A0A427AAC8_ENSVE|nr:hypothetical protein B296_00011954 [Ensete ventricosum]